MRTLELVILQIIASVVIAGVLLPIAVVAVPGVRSAGVGPWVAAGVVVASFLILRVTWPRPKKKK